MGLVVNDCEVSGNELVLQHSTIRQFDLVALVGHDDNRAAENNVAAKDDIALNREMVEFDHLRDTLEALLVVGNLLERVAELHHRGLVEHAARVHHQLAVLQPVQVARDEEQVRAALDGQEARTGHVHTLGTAEVLDSSTHGGLKLNDRLAVVKRLVVGDDLEIQLVVLKHTLDGLEVQPEVVRVENLELLDRLEVLDVLRRHLGNLKQTDSALVVDERTTLDVSLGLVRDLGDELGLGVDHVLVDVEVHNSTQVVHVGHEDVLLAQRNQTVEQARVVHRIEQVTVARRVPEVLVRRRAAGARQQTVAVDAGVAALVEREDLHVVVGVFLDNARRVVVRVERVHQDERHVDVVRAVQVLDLAHGQVQEGHALTNLDHTLGTGAV